MSALSARERLVLAIDTTDNRRAHELGVMARHAGVATVKMGLEVATAHSWLFCSRLAGQYGINWMADAKLHDAPNTVAAAVQTFGNLPHPPAAVTMHASSGGDAMRAAQEAAETSAESMKILGITVPTSVNAREAETMYHMPVNRKVVEFAQDAVYAGLAGVVCSAREVDRVKEIPDADLFTVVDGTRSEVIELGAQAPIMSTADTIRAGADWVVIGEEVTLAEDPIAAFEKIVEEVAGAQH
jgi:orotidine-5'-phosphate decarboxylase